MRAPLSYVPVLPAAVGLVVGIVAYALGVPLVCAVVLFVAFVTLYCMRRHYWSYYMLMTAAGMLLAYAFRPFPPPPVLIDSDHHYVGVVRDSYFNPASISYDVRIDSVDGRSSLPMVCRVTVMSVQHRIMPGTTVAFDARVPLPDPPAVVPYTIDYDRYLRASGIDWRCIVSDVRVLAPPGAFRRCVSHVRDGIYDAIVDSPVTPGLSAFLVASILGDDTMIGAADYDVYSATGVAHMLALSGLHVGILASILSLLLSPLRMWRYGRQCAFVLTVVCIWAYVLVVGGSPSIIRAAVMLTVFSVSRLIQRSSQSWNSLLLAVVVILLVNPWSLFSPGFQLSFAAVASILMFATLLPSSLRRRPVLYYLLNLVLVPVSAMIGTSVISVYYFNVFPVTFLPANIVTGILFPWILGGGVVLMSLTALGLDFALLGIVLDALYAAMQHALSWLSALRLAVVPGLYPSAWIAAPYAAMLAFLAISLRRRRLWMCVATVTMLVVTLTVCELSRQTVPRAEAYVVGDGTSTRVIMRDGDRAWLLSTISAERADAEMRRMGSLYSRFLEARGCADGFDLVTDSMDSPYFAYDDGVLSVWGRSLLVVADTVVRRPARCDRICYALVGAGYIGGVRDILSRVAVDTILLGTDIHPSRRHRLEREIGDSIPYIDLRLHPLAFVGY